MTVSIVNDNKNTVSVTNDSKSDNPTWDEYYDTYAEAEGTWGNPNTPMQPAEAKNLVIVANDSKS